HGIEVASESLEMSRTSGTHLLNCLITGQSILSAINAGDLKLADQLLEEIRPPEERSAGWQRAWYHFLKARAAQSLGKPEQALLHLETALRFAVDLGAPCFLGFCHLTKANILHTLDQNEGSSHHLTMATNLAEQTKSKLLRFYVYLTQALFDLSKRKRASVPKSLRKALEFGKRHEYFNTIIDHPNAIQNLCFAALDAEIEVEYVQQLIRKHKLIPETPPIHLKNWPWELKIITLGRFSLAKDETPVRFTKKAQKKPLLMLKALIAFGGIEVREEQIADALWPEVDGDIAHKSFTTTLHRLRKLLGNHKAVELCNGCLTLNQNECWTDVWAFERICEQAEAAWTNQSTEGDAAEAIELTQKTIEIYKGHFLSDQTDEPWTVPIRERLRNKFLRCVGKLGHYWESTGNLEKAVDCFQRGLEVDGIDEESYRRLMACYHRLGHRAKALWVYDRCKHMLSAVLGIEPSPETEILRKSILG
ncbi:MAG: hypothetical protein JSW26_20050, partial [Desulfobacterales bacterium]